MTTAVHDELQAWQKAIEALDVALGDAATARAEISRQADAMEVIEANAVLGATGSNAEARKAGVTLALAGDLSYQELAGRVRDARSRLADAERRVAVLKERCRLLRVGAALALDDS